MERGREYLFDSKKKKSQFGPPVLCRTFSYDPPLLSLLPPPTTPTATPPPTHTHTGTQGPADLQDITPESFLYLLPRDACFLIHLPCMVCVYVHAVATGTEGGEKEIRRESDRKGEREEDGDVEGESD